MFRILTIIWCMYTTLSTTSPIDIFLEHASTAQNTGNATQEVYWLGKALAINPQNEHAALLSAQHFSRHNAQELTIYYYTKILRHNPLNTAVRKHYITFLLSHGLIAQALEQHRIIIAQCPNEASSYFEAAYVATMIGYVDEALSYYEQVLRILPNSIQALYNMGYILKMAGRVDEALCYYEQVLRLKPDYEPARYATALSYLHKGDFDNGWLWYQEYLQREHLNAPALRSFLANNTLHDKHILLRHQGGLGDTLQFIRFAKTLHAQGAHITALVPEILHPLLRQCPYLESLITPNKDVPFSYDDQTSIMALPAIMGADESLMGSLVPYLYADPELETYWRTIVSDDATIKIGICWQADIKNDRSRHPVAHRGIPLVHLLTALEGIPNIRLYSLQQQDGLDQLALVPQHMPITYFTSHFDDEHGRFMDTAALIKNLDLVITVDTAIAHLAGGLGVPVWLMLPFSTDWRWIAQRPDSPWYPTMKIFKQSTPCSWNSVVEEIKETLKITVGSN